MGKSTWRSKDDLLEAGSFLPLSGSWGLNSGCQSWQQMS